MPELLAPLAQAAPADSVIRRMLSDSAQGSRLDLDAAVPVVAASDATVCFNWSGWQAGLKDGGVAEAAVLEYAFQGEPVVSGLPGAVTVGLSGEGAWPDDGSAVLPARNSWILLPQGSRIVDVAVDAGPGTVIASGVDLALSDSGIDTSQVPQVLYATYDLCGYRLAYFTIFPVQYDVTSKAITYHPNTSVTVTTAPADDVGDVSVRAVAGDLQRAVDRIDNDSALWTYQLDSRRGDASLLVPPGGPYEYVIITDQSLVNAFQPLVNHKASRGLSATIVTTQYIYANYTGLEAAGVRDNADRIRDFIRDAYQSWGTTWVLLGGDTDGYDLPVGTASSIVPHRGCYAGWAPPGDAYNNLPTDMYFACLDGTWNGDGDAIWGEKNDGANGSDVDLLPEVFIGRAPVSNVAEANNFVSKTILYETTPPPNPKWGLWLGEKLADAVPGPPSRPAVWGADTKEMVDSYAKISTAPNNWTLTKLYDRDYPDNPELRWTGQDLIQYLNANPHIVNHAGHSNWDGNARLSRTDVDGLLNTYPYLMFSTGCLTGSFDQSDCIAEHHVKGAHGAVAVVMNSREGLDINPTSCNGTLDKEFWYAIFQLNQRHFGQALDYAKDKIFPGATGIASRWMYFCCTLFGDPETSLALPGSPSAIEGTVYEDSNGDGQRDEDDRGLGDVTVFVDVDNDGVRDDQSATYWAGDVPKNIPDLSTVTSTITIGGLTGRVFDVDVRLYITHTYDTDLDVYLVSSSGQRVELFTDVGGSGDDFAETILDDEATALISAGTAPFSGIYRPEGSLTALEGQDPNGLWTLEITDDAGGDVGQLVSWSLYIDYGDPSAVTNSAGYYAITNLPSGSRIARMELSAGWMYISPPSGWQSVSIPAGQTVAGVDFGIALPADIRGRVWHDIGGDGEDVGVPEVGLASRTVWLDLNLNGARDTGEPTTTTNNDGWYLFAGVKPGPYVVREVLPAGWVRTGPSCDVLYGVAHYGSDQLVVIDPNTFAAIPIGSTGKQKMIGLASDGAGTLYSIPEKGYFNRWLYSVNPITGKATELFDLGFPGLGEGDLALAPDGNTIYAARSYPTFDGAQPPELIRIDLVSRTATVLGQLTIGGSPFPNGMQLDGLAFRGNTLYGLVTWAGGNPEDHLVTIDTASLAVSSAAILTSNFANLGGLAYDPRRGLFYASGAGEGAYLNIYSIDPDTGNSEIAGSTGLSDLSGLAFGTSRGTPLGGAHVVLARPAMTSYANFGEAQPATLSGRKWLDSDGDGLQDEDEVGLDLWTVFLDENGNALLDATDWQYWSQDAPKPLSDMGTTVSTCSVKGGIGRITDVDVSLHILHTWDSDLGAVLMSPSGTRVQLFYRVGGDGDNFGEPGGWPTMLNDESGVPIASGSPPFAGLFLPQESLTALDGEDPNGIWTLEITDYASGDTGTLVNWSVEIESAERSFVTRSGGLYEFRNLLPGSYTVREVNQAGWVRTAPAAAPVLIDDFEDNNLSEYVLRYPEGMAGFTNPLAAHDCAYGAVGMDYMYRVDPAAQVQRGEVISAWVRFANNAVGGASLNFGVSATSSYSLDLSAEADMLDLAYWDNSQLYSFGRLYMPAPVAADTWYRLEVVWGDTGAMEGRLYESDGITLMGSVRGCDTNIAAGGIGFGSWGEGSVRQLDTITRWRDGAHHVVLTSAESFRNADFGNAHPGTIAGTTYHDRDGDRTRDSGEEGGPGWLVHMDPDGDFILDSASDIIASANVPKPLLDRATTTSALGIQGMNGLILDVNVGLNITHTYDGDLEVYLVSPCGTRVELFSRVGADGDNFTDTLLDDQTATPITSGAAPFTGWYCPEGLLSAFNGQDPNGIWRLEVVDAALGDVGALNAWWLQIWHGDPFALTDANGEYAFTGLTPGQYVVREVPGAPFGWLQTAPLMGFHSVPVTSGSAAWGIDFGNALPGSISGFKYNDVNGSQGYEAGEPKLPGWTVFLDTDNNGVIDERGWMCPSADVPKPIPDQGLVISTLALVGLTGRILDVNICLDIAHTWDGDLEAFLSSPSGTRIELFTRVGAGGDNFSGTVLDDQATDPITLGTPPFTGRFSPEGLLSTLNGEDPNGTWALEVRDASAGDVGTLLAWSLEVTYGDPSAITDENGYYAFARLAPGECAVREVPQPGWVQTAPPDGAHGFILTSGEARADVHFGNQPVPSTEVVGRHVFYNNSAWDGNDPAANAGDDAAIATDKTALLPGGTPGSDNCTGFNSGINGIMIDIAGLAADTMPTAEWFTFRTGSLGEPGSWTAAPALTTVAVRRDEGAGGSDRITLIWADGAISSTWLEIVARASSFGLASDDVFYFANLPADYNGDRRVDYLDLGILAGSYRQHVDGIEQGDANLDGLVDYLDLGVLAANYRKSVTGGELAGTSAPALLSTSSSVDGGASGTQLNSAALGDAPANTGTDLLAQTQPEQLAVNELRSWPTPRLETLGSYTVASGPDTAAASSSAASGLSSRVRPVRRPMPLAVAPNTEDVLDLVMEHGVL